ncbi:MAG: hypothetical protein HY238_11495 [Acidobacteria bacterium]|nr:hypothetical protein [Acidobacteriota bacterium]
MPCDRFESLLVDYGELRPEERREADAHLAVCAECRAFLNSLADLDGSLSAAYTGARVSPEFRDSVMRRTSREAVIARPSFVPEILDFLGWMAVVAIVAYVLNQVNPFPTV